jgi:hypothetical protein
VPFALPEQLSPGRHSPGIKRSKRLKIQVEFSVPLEAAELKSKQAMVTRKFIFTERSGVRVIRSLLAHPG